jgi:hypothetical protein
MEYQVQHPKKKRFRIKMMTNSFKQLVSIVPFWLSKNNGPPYKAHSIVGNGLCEPTKNHIRCRESAI